MPSRVSLICERVIEAGWLGALVVTPLLFDVHAESSFELPKAFALRSLALVMLAAWIVRALDRRGAAPAARGASSPAIDVRRWALLAVSLFLVHAVATAFSVAPRLSLWGSLARAQGLFTAAAYLVVFASVLAGLRRREQIERLVSTVLIASFAVSLYGIIQHFGIDPVSWSADVTERVTSTLGNPIFAAAFLVMTVPLTLYRHFEAARRVGEAESGTVRRVLVLGGLLSLVLQIGGWWLGPTAGSLVAATALGMWSVQGRLAGKLLLPFVRVGAYSVLLSAQLACLLLSQSRGPWMGLAAGLGFFAILHGVAQGPPRRVAMAGGLSVGAVLLLVAINVPGAPLSFVRELPYLDRVSDMLRATGQVRMLIWQAVGERLGQDPVRAAVGYGPETLRLVSSPFVSPALGQIERRGALPDRAHNELLDAVVTAGIGGGALYLLLFTSLVAWTLRSLGVVRSARERRALLGLWVGGGLAGAVLSGLIAPSPGFWGPAIPLGMLVGLVLYLAAQAMRGAGSARAPWTALELLQALLLTAVLAHFVETQVGISVTATRTYFWTYAALLVVVRRIEATRREGHEDEGDERTGPLALALVLALVLVTLTYDFVSADAGAAQLPALGWLFILTWLFGDLVRRMEWPRAPGRAGAAVMPALLVLVLVAGFAAAHLAWLRWLGEEQKESLPISYFAVLLLATLGIGAVLGRTGTTSRRARLPAVCALPVVVGAAGILAVQDLNAVRADVAYKQARFASLVLGREDRALDRARRALELEPSRIRYRSLLADLLTRKAQLAGEAAVRDAFFREAEKTLQANERAHPLDPDATASLARFYAAWAFRESDAERREEGFRDSRAHYEKALEQFPANVLLWNELAAVHLQRGDRAGAVETYRRSLALDGRFAETYIQLGDLYQRAGEWEEAAEVYERAIEEASRSRPVHRALAYAYTRMGRLEEALRIHERSLARHPEDGRTHREAARIYFSTGELDRAKFHGEKALALAPRAERPDIERFLAQVDRALAASR